MNTPTAAPAPIPADPFARSVWPRVALVALVAYVVYACAQMEISWERVLVGMENAGRFFSRLFPPNFSRWDLLVKGLLESLEIAVLASTLGIVLALPIGLAAARNLMPPWVSWPARAVIVMARSFHPVIVAMRAR
jgi:phosphonate transport system permease protein